METQDKFPLLQTRSHGRLWIEPCWEQTHQDLPYINEPFNDPESESKWRAMGYTQQRFTGDLYDMRFSEPSWMMRVRQALPWPCFSWSFYKMMPGTVLPEHSDTYLRFREIYKIPESMSILRAIIFLEDWQSGHYLEIDQTPIVSWRAGDGIFWQDDAPHLAANMGKTPRYTLQITGLAEPRVESFA